MNQDDKSNLAGSSQDLPFAFSLVLEPGTVVDERYEIVSFLGEGGMSSVYKARHLLLDRPVVLKLLHKKLVVDENALQRFKREIVAVSALDHDNIVKAYGCGIFSNRPYLVMEYLEGSSLAEVLKQKQRLSKEDALPIFKQILEALSHAHEKGIVHRDLKLSNVMLVGSENLVKLLDFGIAKILPASGIELQKLTRTGDVFGTVIYMSPEQSMGKALDARSDLYSMGCLMYEVLDGKPPFQGETSYITVSKQLHEPPRTSHYLADDFGAAILQALKKDPEQRPQSALELKNALIAAGAYVKSRAKQNLFKSSGRWITAFVMFAVLLVVAAAMWQSRKVYTTTSEEPKIRLKRKPVESKDTGVPMKEEEKGSYFLNRALQENIKQAADSLNRLKHLEAAREAYLEAAKYSLVKGKESVATLRCYSAIACDGYQIYRLTGNPAHLDFAWKYANRASKGFENETSMPDMPEDLIIPEGALSPSSLAKAAAYNVLCAAYKSDPSGHGSLEEAIGCGKKSIALLVSDQNPGLCILAAEPASYLVSLFTKAGKKEEACRTIDELARAIDLAEKEQGLLGSGESARQAAVSSWLTIEHSYRLLRENQKAAEAAKHVRELRSGAGS